MYVKGLSLMLNIHLRDIIPYFSIVSPSSPHSFSLTVTLWYGVVERELDLELGDPSFSLGSSVSQLLSKPQFFVCKQGKIMTASPLQTKWERHSYKCMALERLRTMYK